MFELANNLEGPALSRVFFCSFYSKLLANFSKIRYKDCMFLVLLALFIILPFVELKLLFQMSEQIGGWNTLAVVVVTGIIGAYFTKQEGRKVWLKVRKNLSLGVLPAESLIGGVLIFIGGFLLITPGFITDFVGLSFVFSPTRKLLVMRAKAWLEAAIRQGKIQVNTYPHTSFYSDGMPPQPKEREVFEAQVIDFQEKKQSRDRSEV